MEFTAKQIAAVIGGRVEGDENACVHTFAKIEEAGKGAIAFLANPKYKHYLYETDASIVLVNEDMPLEHEVKATLIRVENAYDSLAKLLQMYESMKAPKTGVHPLAFIAETAKVAEDAYIGAFAYIGENAQIGKGCQIHPNAYIGENVKLADGCIVYPHATVYHDCVIGNRVILHAGCVIGADGFGFAPNGERYDKIPQIGIVTIEDDVEVGANACIDRSTMGSTFIRQGVKIDNLVQIAHNVEVNENTVMAAQCGVAGSTKIGRHCIVGGQVGVTGHIHVADNTTIGAQAGITNHVKEEGTTIIGSPAWDAKGFMKSAALFRRLSDMYTTINKLKAQVDALTKQQAEK